MWIGRKMNQIFYQDQIGILEWKFYEKNTWRPVSNINHILLYLSPIESNLNGKKHKQQLSSHFPYYFQRVITSHVNALYQ